MVPPNIPSSSFSDLQLMGDNDKLTLGKIHERCHKHFVHVDATLRDPEIVGEEVLFHIVVLILKFITKASWLDFKSAADHMKQITDHVIGERFLKQVYHWMQANGKHDDSRPLCTDGSPTAIHDIEEWKKTHFFVRN